eukprot:scaffold63123_cov60-Phaeocystis_antarctica.AAC.1
MRAEGWPVVGPGRAGFGVSASNSGLRWGVQAGMRGAEAVWACAHSWCPESRAPRHDVVWADSGDFFFFGPVERRARHLP